LVIVIWAGRNLNRVWNTDLASADGRATVRTILRAADAS